MPILSGDTGSLIEGNGSTWATVSPGLYEKLKVWSIGECTYDTSYIGKWDKYHQFEDIPPEEQPQALQLAALEWGIGASTVPGIEMTYIFLYKETFRSAYRISSNFSAGDVTRLMAIPWQADMNTCDTTWWPWARPIEIVTENYLNKVLQDNPEKDIYTFLPIREKWTRGLPDNPPRPIPPGTPRPGDEAMVENWDKLGLVVPYQTKEGSVVYYEKERLLPDPPTKSSVILNIVPQQIKERSVKCIEPEHSLLDHPNFKSANKFGHPTKASSVISFEKEYSLSHNPPSSYGWIFVILICIIVIVIFLTFN